MTMELPFVRSSQTSREAAESMTTAPKDSERVLRALVSPMTDEEGATHLNLNPSTYRPRRIELFRKGMIEPKGTRLTQSNRKAVVWGLK